MLDSQCVEKKNDIRLYATVSFVWSGKKRVTPVLERKMTEKVFAANLVPCVEKTDGNFPVFLRKIDFHHPEKCVLGVIRTG